jgi:hypothetical protein
LAKAKVLPEERYYAVPARPRNLFKHVSDNKEIVKCLANLASSYSHLMRVSVYSVAVVISVQVAGSHRA